MAKKQSKSRTAKTKDATNQQEYFLTLIEKLEFDEVIEQCEIDLKSHTMPPLSGDLTYAEAKTRKEIMEAREKGYFEHEFYSISLGVLTPEDAKLVEEYGQGFEWEDANLSPEMKEELVAQFAERVIFTPHEKDAVDIELNGCCNDASLESMWLIAHTDTDRKRKRIIAAKKHFDDREKEGDTRRKLTRDIMKMCVKKAEELRNTSKLTVPVEVIPATSIAPKPSSRKRRKRKKALSDTHSKIVSALQAHHFGVTTNEKPLKVKIIAAKSVVSVGSVTKFFQTWIRVVRDKPGSHKVYAEMCKDDLGRLKRLLDDLIQGYKNYKEVGRPKGNRSSALNIAGERSVNNSLGEDNPLDDLFDDELNAKAVL